MYRVPDSPPPPESRADGNNPNVSAGNVDGDPSGLSPPAAPLGETAGGAAAAAAGHIPTSPTSSQPQPAQPGGGGGGGGSIYDLFLTAVGLTPRGLAADAFSAAGGSAGQAEEEDFWSAHEEDGEDGDGAASGGSTVPVLTATQQSAGAAGATAAASGAGGGGGGTSPRLCSFLFPPTVRSQAGLPVQHLQRDCRRLPRARIVDQESARRHARGSSYSRRLTREGTPAEARMVRREARPLTRRWPSRGLPGEEEGCSVVAHQRWRSQVRDGCLAGARCEPRCGIVSPRPDALAQVL